MTKIPDTTTIIATAAVTIAVGLATYAAFSIFNVVRKMEDIELDFGNDPALATMLSKGQ